MRRNCSAPEIDPRGSVFLDRQDRHAFAGPHRRRIEQELTAERERLGGMAQVARQQNKKCGQSAALPTNLQHQFPDSFFTSAFAVRNRRASSPYAPTSCTPIGMPFALLI